MEAVSDVMNPTVIQAHDANPINVSHMEAVSDVENLTVIQAQ
jgi:hypothetical protein